MALPQSTKAIRWLAAAAEDPRACRRDWQEGGIGIHLLRAGRYWDVLILPACLGLCAADLLRNLPGVDPGPVLLDGRRREVGFFLPPAPAPASVGHGARYITQGGWITAPAPHCGWGYLRWLVPPDGYGTLTNLNAMKLALHGAAREAVCAHRAAGAACSSSGGPARASEFAPDRRGCCEGVEVPVVSGQWGCI